MDINSRDRIDLYIRGYASFNHDVVLFDFGEVIALKNYKENDKVRIVSGGSSCHIEYVGAGILTAAIQGTTFNSYPSHSELCPTRTF